MKKVAKDTLFFAKKDVTAKVGDRTYNLRIRSPRFYRLSAADSLKNLKV